MSLPLPIARGCGLLPGSGLRLLPQALGLTRVHSGCAVLIDLELLCFIFCINVITLLSLLCHEMCFFGILYSNDIGF